MTVILELLVIAATVLAAGVWGAALVATIRTVRGVEVLDAADDGAATGRVTVVTPACDEAARIVASVQTFLAQGPNVDVVAVDDRSGDGTGRLLDELAATSERLRVVHITELPDGWLGKVNALHEGARRATGDWLVFADADVVFEAGAIDRAVAHAMQRDLDCLTLIPQVLSAGFLGDLVFEASGCFVGLAGRWWRVRDADSDAYVGGGAFMLVRRSAFERTPGFEWLRLEVADDQGLGLMMKQHGRTDIAVAHDAISLRWYEDVGDLARRMQKGFFGIMGRFSVLRTVALAAVLLWLGLFPLVLLGSVGAPWSHGAAFVGLLTIWTTSVLAARWMNRSVVSALLVPLGFVVTAIITLRAAYVGWRIGGIEWRGQRYPSDQLRSAQRVIM